MGNFYLKSINKGFILRQHSLIQLYYMLLMKRFAWAFVLLSVLSVGCKKEASDLDAELSETLMDASGGQGLIYFMQPQKYEMDKIPQDPRNPLTSEKVELGRMLYHETGLALNPKKLLCKNTYSCSTCHFASAGFQAGRKQGISDGGEGFGFNGEGRHNLAEYPETDLDVQPSRTPSIMNIAYQTNILWNGQFGGTHLNVGTEGSWTAGTPKETNHLGYEGTETQAIAGINVHRLIADTAFYFRTAYKPMFDNAFPEVPAPERYDRVHTGLAIAAFERTVLSNQAPFQLWLQGNTTALSDQEKRGALLFFGKAECNSCHTGKALSSMEFHALGVTDLIGPGTYGTSTDKVENLGRGGFTGNDADMFKFKVPQLYNLKDSPFYGHGGEFNTIREVVEYKNAAVPENPNVPANKISPMFKPLGLSSAEIDDIVAFLENGLYDPNLHRYEPVRLPSGQCFPNNDQKSKQDMGCIQ